MAKVYGQVAGGRPVEKDAATVGELRGKMEIPSGHSASINGRSASDGDSLADYNVVTFAPQVKGA